MAESHDCGSTTPVFTAKKRTSSSDLGVTADDSLRSSTSETADQNPSFLDLGIADVLYVMYMAYQNHKLVVFSPLPYLVE